MRLILLLVLCSVLVSLPRINIVKASEIIHIRADGSVYPSTANITSLDNVTYTFTGNINDSIVVERNNIIIDGAGYTIEGSGNGNGFSLYNSNNVTINNTNIKGFKYGVYLKSASNNTLSGNNITANNDDGVRLESSSNNILSGNNITNNDFGIWLISSSHNTLSGNVMKNNTYNFIVLGDELSHFMHSIDVSNLIDGKPVYYLVNQKDLVISSATHPQVGFLALINSTNVTVEGLTLTNNGEGLLLAYTNNSRIAENNITGNEVGVLLCWSSSNTLSGNTIANNTDGVWVAWSSNNNVVSGNNMTNNDFSVFAGWSSNNNSISRNNIIAYDGWGVAVGLSSNNTISGNNIIARHITPIPGGMLVPIYGIEFYESSNNSAFENYVTNNTYGVWFQSSSDNIFYRNNFMNNTHQVGFAGAHYANVWDNGVEGNYWSNYTGVDSDHDGIGNTPHIIDANNTDNHPLMGMFSDFNATSEHHVQTICNSTISDFQFNGTAVSFNVSGENGTIGFCRICVPTALMNDPYKVFVNGTEVSHTLLSCSNSTHSYLYFTYNHSTQEIVITPEFPAWTSMLLLLIMLTVAITIYKRRLRKTPIR